MSAYLIFCGLCIAVLKELNTIVDKPYMDEPFHISQAQAYCRGDFSTWDPKITTPPGLYLMSLFIKKIFLLKCNLSMLRLTTTLTLMALPLVLTRLLCYYKRIRPPPSLFTPTLDSIVLSSFPIAWFFGVLYYTEVPSLVFVTWTVVSALQDQHWLAALLGLISCTFRQNNVIWVIYAYAASQVAFLRFRRGPPGAPPPAKLHDPPALSATPRDLLQCIYTAPDILPDILPSFVPYALVLSAFGSFVYWNGGVVLGDKSNHIPTLHVPQLYYFIASATFFGWPVLISGPNVSFRAYMGIIWGRMFGSTRRVLATFFMSFLMAITVKLFTIHHPFLLSDNRHYTFYVWRRIYMIHPLMPYLYIPGYIACGWAWFLRVGREQTLLQSLLIPVFIVPTLLPTPLLEPRYFLIPYVLLRAQVGDVPGWALALEGMWYFAVNAVTMGVFLYLPRDGVGRFMW